MLSWFTEVKITDFAQVVKAHIRRTLTYCINEAFNVCHDQYSTINDTNVNGKYPAAEATSIYEHVSFVGATACSQRRSNSARYCAARSAS